nr:MAG TPA: tail protein [Caudoviricetes sp.]
MVQIIKSGTIKVPTQPKDFDLKATGLVFKSYDNQVALEFNVEKQDGTPADLLGANLRLLMFIYDEIDGTVTKEPIPFITKNLITESFLNGHVVYILPEAMKAYNGMVETYVYIEYSDGSTSDNLGFTFRMQRSKIDGLAQDKADYFITDFQQLLDAVKQKAADAVNETLAKVEAVSENVSSAQNDLTILEDRIDQTNQEIAAVLSDANEFRTDIDTLKINKADKAFVDAQLGGILNKSAITLTHMFADNTARDAYFVANPSELVELQFIKVGTGYQQYFSGAWQAASPVVAEQVSASNQPIVDTGNYFGTDNTNAALQKLGANDKRLKDVSKFLKLDENTPEFVQTLGVYCGSSGYITSTNHDSYELTVTNETTLYFDSYDTQYTSLCVFTSGVVGGSGYTRYRYIPAGENTLPYVGNKVTIPPNSVIVVSVSKTHGNFGLMENGDILGFYLASDIKLNTEQLAQIETETEKYQLTYADNSLTVTGNGVDCVFNDLTFTLQHGLFELQNLTYNGDIIFGTNNDYIGPVRVNGGSIKGAKHDGETTDSVTISTNNGILTNGQSTVCDTFTIFVRSHISDEFSRLSTYTFNGKSLVTNSLITTLKALQIDYIFGCGIISCQDDVNVAWINKTELTEDVMFGLNTNTTIVCDHGTLISKRLSVNSEYGDSRVAFNVYNGRKKLYYYTCYGSNLTVPIDTVFASCVELQFM